jgi:hypothetical protein
MNGATGKTNGLVKLGRGGRISLIGIVLLLAVLVPAATFGAATTLHVTTTIQPWLRFSATPLVGFYQVDAAALRRGYVDLPASLEVELSTNLRDGIALGLASVGPETIRVLEGGSAASGIMRFDAVTSNAPVARRFGLRVLLPAGLGEGTYPLRIEVFANSI